MERNPRPGGVLLARNRGARGTPAERGGSSRAGLRLERGAGAAAERAAARRLSGATRVSGLLQRLTARAQAPATRLRSLMAQPYADEAAGAAPRMAEAGPAVSGAAVHAFVMESVRPAAPSAALMHRAERQASAAGETLRRPQPSAPRPTMMNDTVPSAPGAPARTLLPPVAEQVPQIPTRAAPLPAARRQDASGAAVSPLTPQPPPAQEPRAPVRGEALRPTI